MALDWNDNSLSSPSFVIERSTDGIQFQPVTQYASNTTAGEDDTVSPNTPYTYRIRAINAAGLPSEASNSVSLTTTPSAPAAPSNLAATLASSDEIDLGWTNDPSTSSVDVYRSTGTVFTFLTSLAARRRVTRTAASPTGSPTHTRCVTATPAGHPI